MRLDAFVALVLLFSSVSSWAWPFKFEKLKVASKVYTNVTVISLNATDVYFSHSEGMANAKLRLLEPEAQRVLGYNPERAARLEQQRMEGDIVYQARGLSNLATATTAGSTTSKWQTAEESLSDPISERSLIGQPGPALSYTNWPELTEAPTGKHILLFFWTPWSIPATQSLAQISALQKRFPDQLVVLGLNPDPKPSNGENEIRSGFPTALDVGGKLAAAAGASSVPFALLLSPSGKVLYQGHPAALNEAKLAKQLARTE